MKNIRAKRCILLFLAVWIALVSNFSFAEENKKIYHPYPIIFVHGINPGSWKTFEDTRGNLDEYFYGPWPQKFKYFHKDQEEIFPICDYSHQNNGDILAIAGIVLLQTVKNALSSYPSEIPESERKVIIIAHSMGGLVVAPF